MRVSNGLTFGDGTVQRTAVDTRVTLIESNLNGVRTLPDPTLVGSATGAAINSSGGAYVGASTTLTVRTAFTLRSLTFRAIEADTYRLLIDSVEVATVVASAGSTATFVLDREIAVGSRVLSVRGTANRRVSYLTSGLNVVYSGSGYDFTVGEWNELAGGGYAIPLQFGVHGIVPTSPGLTGRVATVETTVATLAASSGGRSLDQAFKGAWSAGTDYAQGDVVTLAGSSFVAQGNPVIGQSPTGTYGSTPGEVHYDSPSPGSDTFNGNDWASVRFTPTVTRTVQRLSFHTHPSAGTLATGTVGLTTAYSGGTAYPYLTAQDGSQVKATVTTVRGLNEVTFASPVTLQAGTVYAVMFENVGHALLVNASSALSNMTRGDIYYGQSLNQSYSSHYPRFSLSSLPSTIVNPWAQLAAAGATGPAGPAGGGFTRTTATFTTASLAASARETGTVAMAAGYRLYKVQTSRPARVRLYASTAQRDNDTTRAIGTDPTGDHGLALDYVTTGTSAVALSPLVDGFTDDAATSVPITITNLDSATGTVTVTLTYVRTE